MEETERLHFETREEWLEGRMQGIGASEAAAVVGMSPWMSKLELWRLKVGAEKARDLSGSAAVSRGVRMEPALRSLYAAMHPNCTVDYFPYDILYQAERPYIFATLDGEITDEHGRKGVLEIKTSQWQGRVGEVGWADSQQLFLPDTPPNAGDWVRVRRPDGKSGEHGRRPEHTHLSLRGDGAGGEYGMAAGAGDGLLPEQCAYRGSPCGNITTLKNERRQTWHFE